MIARNFFRDGMIMDLAPDNTQNSLLTNALNATFITFNGNEYSLQNDMGNARVETAKLPEGYIPVGSTELGGIIYIAAYNPFTKKCLLGSFPSPERNIEKEEISQQNNASLTNSTFQNELGNIITKMHKIDLGMPILHPGDKFYVCADKISELVQNGYVWNGTEGCVDIYLATINSENKIVKLELSEKSSGHVIGEAPEKDTDESYTLESYRATMLQNYDVYTAKESGKLYIVAELVIIDDFEVATKVDKDEVTWNFKTSSKYGVKPKSIEIKLGKSTLIVDYKETYTKSEINKFAGSDILPKKDAYVITYTPIMPFGKLNDLSVTLTLYYDTTGTTNISEWRYYNTSEYITLRFTINSTKQTNKLQLDFYKLENEDFEANPSFTITYNNLFSVSKNYTETLYFKEYNTTYFQGTLEKNKFYEVKIKIGDSNSNLTKYLYTCPIFNGFYENDTYYKNEVNLYTKLLDFTEINSTYGYGNPIVYPLLFTVKSNFKSNITKSNITNEKVEGLNNLVLDDLPSGTKNIIEYIYNLEVQDECDILLALELDWGGMFSVNNSYTVSKVEEESTTPVSEESTEEPPSLLSEFVLLNDGILKVKRNITNTAVLKYSPSSITTYEFKPIVYNESTANEYGIAIYKDTTDGKVYVRSILSKYPMWYFFSEEKNSNKDFQTAAFVPTWEEFKASEIFDKNNIGSASYKYLDMYNMEAIQNSIKNVIENHNLSIVPHVFAFWGEDNTCDAFIIKSSNKVNANFIVCKKLQIYYTKDKYYTTGDIIKKINEYEIQFDNDGAKIDGDPLESPKIWSFVMLDEVGDYKPINCFMIQSAIPDGEYVVSYDKNGNPIIDSFNCVSLGDGSESMMKQVLDLLVSIYKIHNTTSLGKYVGYATEGKLENNDISLSLTFNNISLNISPNTKINNLNYSLVNVTLNSNLVTELNSIHPYTITSDNNKVLDKITVIDNQYICKLEDKIIDVPNISPNQLYYKITKDAETSTLKLMDRNFVWNNSSSIKLSEDGNLIINYLSDKQSTLENKDYDLELTYTEGDNFFSGIFDKIDEIDSHSINNSISEIDISIETTKTMFGYSNLYIKGKFIEQLDLGGYPAGGSINGTNKLKEQSWSSKEFKIKLNEPIDFTYSCSVELDPPSLIDTLDKSSLKITVTLHCLKTITPNDNIPNLGIGEFLTLKDNKVCLKSNLTGKDRSVSINAGGPSYITDWKFNSKIQFKNEFAI